MVDVGPAAATISGLLSTPMQSLTQTAARGVALVELSIAPKAGAGAEVFQTSGVAARSGEQDFGSSSEKIVPPWRVDTTLMSPPCERAI
jgi:hypothetical protein